MRHRPGVQKTRLAALSLLLALTLTGCALRGQDTRAEELKKHYVNLTSYRAEVDFLADYGTYVYQYEAALTGTADGGSLCITRPEHIAGITCTWSGGEGGVQYGDISLETGSLSPDGLSPADAIPVFLDALARGVLRSAGDESLDGEEVLRLELTNPSLPEGEETVTVWLARAGGELRRGEITWQGETVIRCDFRDFQYTYSDTEPETEG